METFESKAAGRGPSDLGFVASLLFSGFHHDDASLFLISRGPLILERGLLRCCAGVVGGGIAPLHWTRNRLFQ